MGRWRGQWEGGDGDGATGRGRWERGQRGGGEEGARGEGISQMDKMKRMGGMRLQNFLTLFTRATPGTPASRYNCDLIDKISIKDSESSRYYYLVLELTFL